MTIQLTEDTGATLALRHTEAAEGITGLASGVPAVDGGYATPHLREILAVVVSAADQVAVVNEAAAAQVAAVGQELGTTDDEVADHFRSTTVAVR